MDRKAVALKYDQNVSGAPMVVAKGKNTIAEAIIKKAQEHDVPLFQNKELVDSLISLEVDREIPAQLYNAVVEVFVWLTTVEKKRT